MSARSLVASLLALAVSGCTHIQLRNNGVNQAWSVGDMQQQQVLNNLAMFVYDYNSMPHFSYPNQSSANVTDQGTVGVTSSLGLNNVNRLVFDHLGLAFGAQRQSAEGFTVTPVNDPRKLELMRCAYQQAVASCCGRMPATDCPDCQTRFKVFYTGDVDGDIRQGAKGTVTSECLKSDGCWFHVCCKKCVAKHRKCCAIGEHCGVYVWVGPEGRDELTKLTLAILDYALNNPPQQLKKNVVYYIDENGLPTTEKHAVGKVSADIGITERNESLLKTDRPVEARIEALLDRRLRGVREQLARTQDAAERSVLLEEEQILLGKLDFLQEQLRIGGLKEKYYPRTATPVPSGLLLLQQDLNTLGSPGVGTGR